MLTLFSSISMKLASVSVGGSTAAAADESAATMQSTRNFATMRRGPTVCETVRFDIGLSEATSTAIE